MFFISNRTPQGTQITVEDLFYNVTTRRKVLKSGADEFSRVADVVTKYAVHNAGVAFTLKRSGENSLSVRTQRGASARDNVATLYGSALAKELIEVGSGDKDGGGCKSVCEFKAIVSNVNYTAAKKFHFLVSEKKSVQYTTYKGLSECSDFAVCEEVLRQFRVYDAINSNTRPINSFRLVQCKYFRLSRGLNDNRAVDQGHLSFIPLY